MTKTLAALAAASALAIVAVGAPSDAHAGRRGAAVAAGVLGGLAAGAFIGGALAGPRPYYYYEPEPMYVEPPPRYCVERQWVWSERRGDYVPRRVRVPC